MSISNACQAIAAWATATPAPEEGRSALSFLAAALLIATADGPVDDGERAQLVTLYAALQGDALDDATIQAQVDFNEQGADARIAELNAALPNESEKDLLVSFAALMACADRGVNAKEGAMLQKLGQGVGFSHNHVLELLAKAMNAASHGVPA